MPCNHKFQKELGLELIDYKPEVLIVGVFSPEIGEENPAEWFYGRTEDDCFWEVLPRVYGEPSLINGTPSEWKAFCRKHKIAFTDLISEIEDADPDNPDHAHKLGGFSDNAIVFNFDDLVYVDIVQALKKHPSIKSVYLTRGITEAFWRHLWNPVMHYCSHNGIRERRLLNTAEDVSYQLGAYNEEHPGSTIARAEDYVLMKWKEEYI